ncbi:MAG TPA: glycosyltransferase [Thermoflexia bacterium]|nr:glycosyltransferase [Thermoflexia bacterium]
MKELISYLYMAVLTGLAIYALQTALLIILYLWHRQDAVPPTPPITAEVWPVVTVQVPLRNERYVVRRILRSVAALEWPREQLEIQVLDDSTDQTTVLAQQEAARLRAQGLDIHVYHRQIAAGHKAGALAASLPHARGEYIAIFDADFYPPADFLQETVPQLVAAPRLGMVQGRWGHLNADYSPITRAQSLLMDAHFTVEHIARNRSGLLMNFNGTAGVWRRQTIVEAGGWQSDTLAEDLDLSYRAQLAGWRLLYLPHVVAAAELPPLVAAFKQQQYRWAKGAIQVLRKLAKPIWRSERLTWSQKIMGLLHLSGYLTQPLFLLMLLLTLPLAYYQPALPSLSGLLGTILCIPPLLYLLGQMALYHDWPRRILAYPVVMLLGIGITWSTTLAIIDGWRHWGGAFTRTPKFQLHARQGNWRGAAYRIALDHTLWGELFLGCYSLLALWQTIAGQQNQLLPLVLLSLGGEGLLVLGTLSQAKRSAA